MTTRCLTQQELVSPRYSQLLAKGMADAIDRDIMALSGVNIEKTDAQLELERFGERVRAEQD